MKKMLFLAAVSAIALTSCVNEENFEGPKPQAQAMRFDAPVMKQTRANVMGEITGVKYDAKEDFKVFCKIYKGSFAGWGTNTTDYFSTNGDVAKNMGGTSSYWATATTYSWPEGEYNLAFAAYSPAELTLAPTSVKHTANGLQIEGFKTETEAQKQYDLMYSDRVINKNETNDGQNAVPLVFRHALTSIVFSSEKLHNEVDYEIKSVTLTGSFIQEADFNQNIVEADNLTSGTARWENKETATAANYVPTNTPGFTPFKVPYGGPEQFTGGESALLLIPQDVPGDAEVFIEYDKITQKGDGGVNIANHTATIPLSNFKQAGGASISTWAMGKRYIYRISFGGVNNHIYFEPSTENWVTEPTLIHVIE